MQAVLDVAEGITDEDYDLFYEVWQEFDPKGTQYMSFENLSEFLDCLEQPLSVPKPNKYKIIKMDIPIITFTNPNTGEVKEDCIFCADVLDILTQDFFSRRSDNPVVEENPQHVEEVKVSRICYFDTKNSYQGWSQIGIHSKFVHFNSKICVLIDSKGQKIYEKFDEN